MKFRFLDLISDAQHHILSFLKPKELRQIYDLKLIDDHYILNVRRLSLNAIIDLDINLDIKKYLEDGTLDPSTNNGSSLIVAMKKNRPDVIRNILNDPRMQKVVIDTKILKLMIKWNCNSYIFKYILQAVHFNHRQLYDIINPMLYKFTREQLTAVLTSLNRPTIDSLITTLLDNDSNRSRIKQLAKIDNPTINSILANLTDFRKVCALDLDKVFKYQVKYVNGGAGSELCDICIKNDSDKCFRLLMGLKHIMLLNKYLIDAIQCRSNRILTLLLSDSRIDPSYNKNEALITVCNYSSSYTDIIEHLLNDPAVDPTDRQYEAFFKIAGSYNSTAFELFLKHHRVDPTYFNNKAVQIAANRNMANLKLLLNDKRVLKTLTPQFLKKISDALPDSRTYIDTRKLLRMTNEKLGIFSMLSTINGVIKT
jgi:hypothetical protein